VPLFLCREFGLTYMNRKLGWWFSVFMALACVRAIGQETVQQNDSVDSLFHRGEYELSLATGPMFSPIGADKGRPTVDYTLSGLQLGWMVTDVHASGWLRGNLEIAGEVIGGAVYQGRGNYIAGGTAWARYNFVHAGWRLVPYIDAGAGAEATDMDSRLIGERFNFNLNVGVGTRCFIAQNWSINVECLYQHISNAKLSSRDIGINAVGPMVSLSYFF